MKAGKEMKKAPQEDAERGLGQSQGGLSEEVVTQLRFSTGMIWPLREGRSIQGKDQPV
jgi:hypothetical protein